MNTNRNTKVGHQRNITPNFLRFKRTPSPTQANPPPNQKKKNQSIIPTMPNAATPKPADAASTFTKKECCTSASLVKALLSRKHAQYKTQVGLA